MVVVVGVACNANFCITSAFPSCSMASGRGWIPPSVATACPKGTPKKLSRLHGSAGHVPEPTTQTKRVSEDAAQPPGQSDFSAQTPNGSSSASPEKSKAQRKAQSGCLKANGRWQYGLFHCGTGRDEYCIITQCCQGILCSCFMAGEIHEYLHGGGWWIGCIWASNPITAPCWLAESGVQVAQKSNFSEDNLWALLKATFCGPCYAAQVRREISLQRLGASKQPLVQPAYPWHV